MLPVAPLMIEHRLIERMIKLMDGEAGRIRQSGLPNTDFINVAIDFIRIYADKLHHGKEEDILFRDLAKFYPIHIEKEDKRFFIPVMDYLNDREKELMLNECYEFDRKFIHAKYKDIVAGLEGSK